MEIGSQISQITQRPSGCIAAPVRGICEICEICEICGIRVICEPPRERSDLCYMREIRVSAVSACDLF